LPKKKKERKNLAPKTQPTVPPPISPDVAAEAALDRTPHPPQVKILVTTQHASSPAARSVDS